MMKKDILVKGLTAFTILTSTYAMQASVVNTHNVAHAYADDRVQVKDVTQSPYKAIVAVGNSEHQGSGVVVGPHTVVTNKHVVGWQYDHPEAVRITPMATAGSNGGLYQAEKVIPFPGEEDLVVIHIKPQTIEPPMKKFDQNAGILSLSDANATQVGDRIHTAGYPGDKARGTMWKADGRITEINGSSFVMSLYTVGGQSGSPIYNDQQQVVGIVRGGPEDVHAKITDGVFFNQDVIQFIKANIKK